MNTDNHNPYSHQPADVALGNERHSWGRSESLARFFYGAILQADPQAPVEEHHAYTSAKLTISRRSAER